MEPWITVGLCLLSATGGYVLRGHIGAIKDDIKAHISNELQKVKSDLSFSHLLSIVHPDGKAQVPTVSSTPATSVGPGSPASASAPAGGAHSG